MASHTFLNVSFIAVCKYMCLSRSLATKLVKISLEQGAPVQHFTVVAFARAVVGQARLSRLKRAKKKKPGMWRRRAGYNIVGKCVVFV